MRFRSLHLRDFRNIPEAHVDLDAPAVFIAGANGQGKTNLLEALGLLAALRSFRAGDRRALIRWGAAEAGVRVELEHDTQGETEVTMALRSGALTVAVDGERVERLTGFLGLFPVVAFSSQDIQLLRGAPQGRRQFMDLSFSMVDAEYLEALRRYHGALRERNRLLKGRAARSVRAAFEAVLIPEGARVMAKRAEALRHFAAELARAYRHIAPREESPELVYRPAVKGSGEDALRAALEGARDRDEATGTTTAGPHRDDFSLRLLDHGAREYGSEGQQRGLVLSLRLAQAQWFGTHTGVRPVILADDILGELDPVRRTRFWGALPEDAQIIATGTELPETGPWGEWAVYSVEAGAFQREDDIIFE
ncbi:MAG: DNA replication and repair protein RecF [Opitutales bacterium]|nr:DNA replication and repair protein RecF [Opitutales bacterium]